MWAKIKSLFQKKDSLEGFQVNVQKFQQIRAGQIAPDAIDESNFKPATRTKFLQDWGTPTFVQVYKTAAQNISSSVWTKVVFDGEVVDAYNEFASSRFTALEPGRYAVSAGIKWDGITDGQRYALAIYVNGASYSEVFDMAATTKFLSGNVVLTSSGSVSVRLDAGGYIEVYAWSSGSARIAQGIKNAYLHVTKAR